MKTNRIPLKYLVLKQTELKIQVVYAQLEGGQATNC